MLVAPLQAVLVLLPVLAVVLMQVVVLLPMMAVGQMWVPHLLVVVMRKGPKALKLIAAVRQLVAPADM